MLVQAGSLENAGVQLQAHWVYVVSAMDLVVGYATGINATFLWYKVRVRSNTINQIEPHEDEGGRAFRPTEPQRYNV